MRVADTALQAQYDYERCAEIDFCHTSYYGCLDGGQFLSVLALLSFAIGGLILQGMAIQATRIMEAEARAGGMWLVGFAIEDAVGIVVALAWLVRPHSTWDPETMDVLQVMLGGLLVAALGVNFLACVKALCAGRSSYRFPHSSRRLPLEPSRWSFNSGNVLRLVVVVVLGFLATAGLAPVFNYGAIYYWPSVSPYNIVGNKVVIGDCDAVAPAPGCFVLKIWWDAVVYFAFLLLVIAVGCASHFLPGLRGTCHRRLKCFAGRLSGKWWNFYPHGVTVGEIVLTVAVLALFAFWFAFWGVLYDRIDVDAHRTFNSSLPGGYQLRDSEPELHIWARVMGHMTSLCISFLTFPIARSSMWEYVFGMPFERGIKYHRALGLATYTMLSVHTWLWYAKWIKQGVFAHNLVHFDAFFISDTLAHYDNFTIVLCQMSYVGVSIFVGIALFCRRRNYELFLYTHYFAYFFFVVALMHAWTFWYYGAGGIILYAFDKVLRMKRGSDPPRLMRIDTANGVTRLVFSSDNLRHFAGQYAFINFPRISPLQWHPFSISSSPSAGVLTFHIKDMGEGTWTRQLRMLASELGGAGIDYGSGAMEDFAQGRGDDRDRATSFSSTVSEHTMTLGLSALHVGVDGPYGRASYFSVEHSVLVLVCGGIGVTPMHSILAELFERAQEVTSFGEAQLGGSSGAQFEPLLGAGVGSVKHVKFVWSSRAHVDLTPFADTFYAIAKSPVAGMFDIRLHSTQKGDVVPPVFPGDDGGAPSAPKIMPGVSRDAVQWVYDNIVRGRPDMKAVFRSAQAELSRGEKGMAMVCGPPPVVSGVSDMCFEHGFDYHTEIFAF